MKLARFPALARSLAPALLASACVTVDGVEGPGQSAGLDGPAVTGSWWADRNGTGRCSNLVPDDGWSAGLDASLLDFDDPYDGIDAGLTQIVDALDGVESFDSVPADLWIDGAVISNVGSSPDSELWFADGNVVIPTVDLTGGVAGAQPGDVVRFHVNALKKDYGVDKISGIDSFEILDTGFPIAVVQPDWNQMVYDHGPLLNQNIAVVGELVALDGPCGGSASCYFLAGNEQDPSATVTFRVSNSLPMGVGACVQLIAPLGEFSNSPQFNLAAPGGDTRWVRRFL